MILKRKIDEISCVAEDDKDIEFAKKFVNEKIDEDMFGSWAEDEFDEFEYYEKEVLERMNVEEMCQSIANNVTVVEKAGKQHVANAILKEIGASPSTYKFQLGYCAEGNDDVKVKNNIAKMCDISLDILNRTFGYMDTTEVTKQRAMAVFKVYWSQITVMIVAKKVRELELWENE